MFSFLFFFRESLYMFRCLYISGGIWWGFLMCLKVGGASGKEPTCQHRLEVNSLLNPWVGKISWRKDSPGILAWRIPWTEEPGELQFIGSHRVGHD